MPIDKEIVGKVIDQSSGVIEKAYDDLAHPTAKSLGNTLSLLPRTVGVWLGKWEKWVINGEESIRLTAEAVREKARKIPEEELTEPEPYVAIPTVQQLSYCYDSEELRNMYANLLVSAMNQNTKMDVHPGFTSIINQLSPLDVKALDRIKARGGMLSLVSIQLQFENKNFIELVCDYAIDLKDILWDVKIHSATLQNLKRLGLINVRYDQQVKPDEVYDIYQTDSVYIEQKSEFEDKNKRLKIKRGLVEFTEFGLSFCKVCCD